MSTAPEASPSPSPAPNAAEGPKPAAMELPEFTIRALLIGLVMCVVLGAANAYLGLRAGMTIAATYPAAVIGMAVLKLMKGSLLEENFARTVGSIGESVAAGAAFTIPAFVILKYFDFGLSVEHPAGVPVMPLWQQYVLSSALMILGGTLGILLVTVLRRVMVEDPGLPFPESVAASEIHKAGQRGADAAVQLFKAMGVGAVIKILGRTEPGQYDGFGIFQAVNKIPIAMDKVFIKLKGAIGVTAGGATQFTFPAATPAYLGVGYIVGPELGALNFAGGLLAWGLFVPLLVFLLGPGLIGQYGGESPENWEAVTAHLYKFIVRPVAVGGMLTGACYTLFKMRKNLVLGIQRGVADVRKAAGASAPTERTQRDLSFKLVAAGLVVVLAAMVGLFFYFTSSPVAAIAAAVVMLITGFFFAAVSGNLVGIIGSSNNPISGLTLATTIIAAGTMVVCSMKGPSGVMAALGVAAVGCVSAAVAGEMLQDLKVGHILKGTPWRMQVGDLIGVLVAGLVLFWPFYLMHTSDVAQNGPTGGFGGSNYSAPQAGLMAALSQGIVGGEMAWPLVVVGIMMGVALILIKVKSPMLFSVGMYLPLETTFAIFVGGLIKWVVTLMSERRKHNAAQKARVENTGVLVASGLIAGEALVGLIIAGVIAATADHRFPVLESFQGVAPWLALAVFAVLAAYLILVPLKKAGSPDEPAPPTAVM